MNSSENSVAAAAPDGSLDSRHANKIPDSSIRINSVRNLRAIGSFPISHGQSVRGGAIIRSANLDHVSLTEAERLRSAYGFTAIFDLRDAKEATTKNQEYFGVPIHQLSAIGQVESYKIAKYFQALDADAPMAFANLYLEMCRLSGPAFKVILLYLRDNPGDLVLVHCELGKDRTGVFIAVILCVLEVSDDDIICDYQLSESQIVPIIDERIAKLYQHPLVIQLKLSPAALSNHFLASADSMRQFLGCFREVYGTGVGYLRSIGLNDNDISLIRENLINSK